MRLFCKNARRTCGLTTATTELHTFRRVEDCKSTRDEKFAGAEEHTHGTSDLRPLYTVDNIERDSSLLSYENVCEATLINPAVLVPDRLIANFYEWNMLFV